MIALALCVVVVVALLALLFLLQPTLNLSPLKGLLEAQLTGLAGAPITLEELYLKPSLEPRVEVRGLRVGDLVSVETIQLQIELIPLLKRHVSIDSSKLDQVTVQLRPTLELVRSFVDQQDRPKSPYRVDALENLEFDRIQVNVTDDLGVDHRLVIDELDGEITRTTPLKLVARGSFDNEALQFQVGGPTLEDLLAPTSTLPFTAGLEIAAAELSLEGTFDKHASPPTLALVFSLEGDALEATLEAASVQVPPLGAFHLGGSLFRSDGPIQLSDLEGKVGGVDLSGHLQVGWVNEQLTLAGSLNTGRIDLQPWLDPPPAGVDSDIEDAGTGKRVFDHPLPAEPIERALATMDIDLEVTLEGIDGLPTTFDTLKGNVRLQDDRMTLPFDLHIAGAPVQGKWQLASLQNELQVALDLSSSAFPLDQLTADLGRGLTTGIVGRLHLSAASSGTTLGALLNQLDLRLETGNVHLRFRSLDNEREVDLALTHMALRRGPEVPVWLTLNGELRGHPYHIELAGRGPKDWDSDDPWPFTLSAEGLGAKASIEGRLSLERDDRFLELELDLSGDRIGDLEPWWGVPAKADASYGAHGYLTLESDRLELQLDTFRLGRTTASMTLLAPRGERTPIQIDLRSPAVVLDEALQLIDSEEKETAAAPVLTVDIPIWTEELLIPATTVHLELDHVLRDSEDLADLSNVVADAEISRSHLERVAFSARVEEAVFQGQLDFDWASEPPRMNLDLGGEAIDLGRLIELDSVAPNLVVRAQRFNLRLTGAERTVRLRFLEGVHLSGAAEGVYLSTLSLDKRVPLELTLDKAEISESPSQPILVKARGSLRQRPLDLRLTLDNKNPAIAEEDPIPLDLVLQTGDVHLEARGELTLPASLDNLGLDFSLSTDRISSLEPFTGHRISEVGPVAATGRLSTRPGAYTVEGLSLEVGDSDINGSISLDVTASRHRLRADLTSQRIHLGQLLASHSLPGQAQRAPEEDSAGADDSAETEEEETWLDRLQASRLANLDLDVTLESEDLYWGGETGGGGEVRVQSEQGRLAVGPFHLALADGRVEGQALVHADSGLVNADVEFLAYNVEYGPILRYFDPDTEGDGTVDLETRFVTTGAPVDRLIAAANGGIRFALFPRDIDTTLLNFWGAGLFRSMFRVVDPTDESILNCMVGDFSLAEGQMTANDFWFDTSSVRAHGKGSIDLENMTLDMKLRPRPKRRTFLTLATPARIKGPVEKPRVSLTTGGMVGTGFRIYMWWLTIYTQVFRKPLPRDGSDVCVLPPPPGTADEPLGETSSPPGS